MAAKRTKAFYDRMRATQDDPSSGELGVIRRGGSTSTELSRTSKVDGKWINYPMLVTGQSAAAVERIMSGKGNAKDERVAIKRFSSYI